MKTSETVSAIRGGCHENGSLSGASDSTIDRVAAPSDEGVTATFHDLNKGLGGADRGPKGGGQASCQPPGRMTIQELLTKVEGVTRRVNGWMARCPAHDDKNPSLSISESSDGKLLVHCHAGCTFDQIMAAVVGPTPAAVEVAAYEYTDSEGRHLFEVVRYRPKRFRIRRNEGGSQVWRLDQVRPVLYRLPSVIDAVAAGRIIFVPEGEEDVLAIEAVGEIATCNPMGAGKWRAEYSQYLRGADVVIVADKDETGYRHAGRVREALLGIAESVRIVQARTGKDARDHFKAGHSLDDLDPVEESLLSCFNYMNKHESKKSEKASGFNLTSLVDLLDEPPEETSYLVDDLLPTGGTSLLCAKPKVGKSTLARCVAYSVAGGEPFFGRSTVSGKVLYFAFEEKRSEVQDHFRRLGATAENVLIHFGMAPASALAHFVALVQEHEPVLAIIDPLFKLIRPPKGDDYAGMSAAMEPLIELARETGCHILATHHARKAGGSEGDAVLGSTAIFAAVDTLVEMKKTQAGRVVWSNQRYGNDLPETVASYDEDLGTVTPAGDVKALRLAEAMTNVLASIQLAQQTEQELREDVGGDRRLTSEALKKLLSDGEIVRVGEGKKGSPFFYSVPHVSAADAPPSAAKQEDVSTSALFQMTIEDKVYEVIE